MPKNGMTYDKAIKYLEEDLYPNKVADINEAIKKIEADFNLRPQQLESAIQLLNINHRLANELQYSKH